MSTFPFKVAVASSVRTPVGRALKGSLAQTRPDDLMAAAMKEAVTRVDGVSGADLDDVVIGCAMPEAEQGLNIARNAVFLAEFPDEVPAETINRFCSSGLAAYAHGAMAIHAGVHASVLVGGVESMSMVPMGGNKTSLNPTLMERYPEAYISMGHTAERVAQRFEVSREEQDAFALRSHQRAVQAIESGAFEDETFAVKARAFGKGAATSFDFTTDESPRASTSLEALAKLRPVFHKKGTVTAGNSSPLNDGAAAGVLLSEEKIAASGVRPLGYMCGYAVAGVAPDIMGIGPVPAIRRLLAQTGLSIDAIDLFEINEAFAAQAVYCQRELGIDEKKLNVHGGGIALGHPLGCTGAKLTSTLLHALQKRGGGLGIVSMCIGGGMGAAGLFKVG